MIIAAKTVTERAILVGADFRRRAPGSISARTGYTPEESLEELAALARSAGAEVLDSVLQARHAPDSATLIGSGKVDELVLQVKALDADCVLFDQELTPTQQRNLEKQFEVKVLDRTQLILDIFARRARTHEGRLQVELAQLNYILPRLTGQGVQMSRLGGGIGTRGPGETKLETDRRRIHHRISRLKAGLAQVQQTRKTQRGKRLAVPLSTVALVGYTNAGKSTLFNRLTGAEVLADAKMFATLDPTVRAIALPSRRKVLLSDTVGFIRNLPTTLVKAFRATLEEVTEAALLLHVVDASSPGADEQIAHVRRLLEEIHADGTPQIMVWNKVDRVNGPCPPGIAVSALAATGIAELYSAIDRALTADPLAEVTFRIPSADGATLHAIHDSARIISKRLDEDTGVYEVVAEAPESLRTRFADVIVTAPAAG